MVTLSQFLTKFDYLERQMEKYNYDEVSVKIEGVMFVVETPDGFKYCIDLSL